MHPFLDFTSLQINKLATDASVLVADMPYQIVGTYSLQKAKNQVVKIGASTWCSIHTNAFYVARQPIMLQTLVFVAWNATAYRVKRIIVNSAAHGSVSYAQKDL